MVGEKGTCLFIGKISLCEMSSRDGLDDEGCSHKKKRGYVGKIPKRVEGGGGHLHCRSIVFSVQSNSRGHKVMAICKKSGIKHESSSSSEKITFLSLVLDKESSESKVLTSFNVRRVFYCSADENLG